MIDAKRLDLLEDGHLKVCEDLIAKGYDIDRKVVLKIIRLARLGLWAKEYGIRLVKACEDDFCCGGEKRLTEALEALPKEGE